MNMITIKIGTIIKFFIIILCAMKISAAKLMNGGAPILSIAPINQNRARIGDNLSIPLVRISLRDPDFS